MVRIDLDYSENQDQAQVTSSAVTWSLGSFTLMTTGCPVSHAIIQKFRQNAKVMHCVLQKEGD